MHSGVITVVFVEEDSPAMYNILNDDEDKETKRKLYQNQV